MRSRARVFFLRIWVRSRGGAAGLEKGGACGRLDRTVFTIAGDILSLRLQPAAPPIPLLPFRSPQPVTRPIPHLSPSPPVAVLAGPVLMHHGEHSGGGELRRGGRACMLLLHMVVCSLLVMTSCPCRWPRTPHVFMRSGSARCRHGLSVAPPGSFPSSRALAWSFVDEANHPAGLTFPPQFPVNRSKPLLLLLSLSLRLLSPSFSLCICSTKEQVTWWRGRPWRSGGDDQGRGRWSQPWRVARAEVEDGRKGAPD